MKKKSNFKDVVSNTFTVVAKRNLLFFLSSLAVFVLLYMLFYGIFTVPILEIGFFKDTSPTMFDYFYIVYAAVASSLIVTLTKYSLQNKVFTRGVSFFGISAGLIGAICPVCLGVNILVLGNFITVPLVFLVPYVFWIQLAGIALLTIGFWLTMKTAYEKICLVCATPIIKEQKIGQSIFGQMTSKQSFVFLGLAFLAIVALGYQTLPMVFGNSITGSAVAVNNNSIDLNAITSQVLPTEGFTLDVTWQDSVSKMVNAGVLDVDKLNDIMTKRYGKPLTDEQKTLLTSEFSNEKLTINSDNAVFMMYVLWTLAKHNDNEMLHDSPFAKYFDDYDIGVGKSGYGDTKLIELDDEQQQSAEKVALNSYRPCCGNPTGHPDCSHGYAALGLIELMASQGYSEQEMFDAFVKFNSFWFPATYIQDAIYFKLTENKDWSDVDDELVAGKQYSSLSGSYAVKQYLQNSGL